MLGVADIQEDPVARTRARSQPDRRVGRDVVALVGLFRRLRARAMVARFAQPIHRASLRIGEYAGRADDLRVLRRGQRDPDHFDPEQRGVRIDVRLGAGASRQLRGRPHGRGARDVDPQDALVLGIGNQRVRV